MFGKRQTKMDAHHVAAGSPSSSTSSSSDPHHLHRNGGRHHRHHYDDENNNDDSNNNDPMHAWWESISKARSRIHILSSILPPASAGGDDLSLSSLADSDRPARSLLSSLSAYSAVSSSLHSPSSGAGDDSLCHWLYDTFLSSDPDLRLVVLSFIPVVSGIYLSRIHSLSSPSLAGFEAVLLAVYASETKSRGGKPILINIPDLSQPSLYHTPRVNGTPGNRQNPNSAKINNSRSWVGVISPSLEPQNAMKSTKRASIVGVALDCYYKQISQLPSWSKLDFCKFAADWAGEDCPCKYEFDRLDDSVTPFSEGNSVDEIEEKMENLAIHESSENYLSKGGRIPLPWELLQPVLRILGHCLLAPLNSEDVKDAASVAARCLYARASHYLVPQAILATRSLIQLDNRAREAAKAVAAASAASSANTPSKAKKPEILLVSK